MLNSPRPRGFTTRSGSGRVFPALLGEERVFHILYPVGGYFKKSLLYWDGSSRETEIFLSTCITMGRLISFFVHAYDIRLSRQINK